MYNTFDIIEISQEYNLDVSEVALNLYYNNFDINDWIKDFCESV